MFELLFFFLFTLQDELNNMHKLALNQKVLNV
jgi:hypothetical protein